MNIKILNFILCAWIFTCILACSKDPVKRTGTETHKYNGGVYGTYYYNGPNPQTGEHIEVNWDTTYQSRLVTNTDYDHKKISFTIFMQGYAIGNMEELTYNFDFVEAETEYVTRIYNGSVRFSFTSDDAVSYKYYTNMGSPNPSLVKRYTADFNGVKEY